MTLPAEQSTALIQRLREDLDAPSLNFKVPPRKIAEGGDATVYLLELLKSAGDAEPRQVLRVFHPSKKHHDAEVESYRAFTRDGRAPPAAEARSVRWLETTF